MNDPLTQEQIAEMREAMSNNTFSPQLEVIKLVALGYDIEVAKELIIAEIKSYKKELFDKAIKRDNQGQARYLVFILIFILSIIGPFFHIESILWYIVVIALSGLAGYFAYKHKPVAGIVGAVIATMIFPFAWNFYFADRGSFIKIEMVIPMLMAAVPAIGAYYLLSMLIYPNVDND